MLRLEGLKAGYGRNPVLFDVSLAIEEGQVATLMGRNGMGKTTTVRAIMGLLGMRSGRATFAGRDLLAMRPEDVARAGVGLVPEGRRVFTTLNVRENLVATAVDGGGDGQRWTLDSVLSLFPALQDRLGQKAATLSGGEQQMLAIGRALMTNPRLLILDEATEGLAPVVRSDIWRCVRTLKEAGLAILLIDKNIHTLQRLADRHHVIEKGRTVWTGDSKDLAAAAEEVQRYVGL